MLRLLLVGLLFLAVPALASASKADDPKGKEGSSGTGDSGDKKDAKSGTQEVEVVQLTWLGKIADVGAKIGPLVQMVLLTLICFLLIGLRSDIGKVLVRKE